MKVLFLYFVFSYHSLWETYYTLNDLSSGYTVLKFNNKNSLWTNINPKDTYLPEYIHKVVKEYAESDHKRIVNPVKVIVIVQTS